MLLSRLAGRQGCAWAVAGLSTLVALAAPAASAVDRDHRAKISGRWTNPVGACVAHIIEVDPATGDVLSCKGTSNWTGTWKGSTNWTLTGDVGLTSGGSGRIDEVFKGHARDGRKGRLTFREHFTLDAAGKIDIKGKIVKSSGKLAGSRGRARWIGTAKADGSGKGTYSGHWQEGLNRSHR
jgi:hypothetical protein